MTSRERLSSLGNLKEVWKALGTAAGAVAVVWILAPYLGKGTPVKADSLQAVIDAVQAPIIAHETASQEARTVLKDATADTNEKLDILIGLTKENVRLNKLNCLSLAKNDTQRRDCVR